MGEFVRGQHVHRQGLTVALRARVEVRIEGGVARNAGVEAHVEAFGELDDIGHRVGRGEVEWSLAHLHPVGRGEVVRL
jgi:hypothetical protein